MKIKEVAAQTGLTEKAIRFYESKKLITPQTYELNGRTFRAYTEENIRTLTEIAVLRRAFFSVGQIQEILGDPSRTEEVFRAYRDSLCTDYAAMTPLIGRLESGDIPPMRNIADVADFLGRESDTQAPPPKELRLSRSDESTDREREEAYRIFLRRQAIRDRRDSILTALGKVLRVVGILLAVLIGVYVLWFTLDNVRIVRQVEYTIEGVEWQEGNPESAVPRTITLTGELRDYLFHDDYGKLSVAISGYDPAYYELPAPLMYVTGRYGTDNWHARIFDPMMREGEAVLLDLAWLNSELGVGILKICENTSPGSYTYDPDSGKSFLLAFGITDAEKAEVLYAYSDIEDRLRYEKNMAELREKREAAEK